MDMVDCARVALAATLLAAFDIGAQASGGAGAPAAAEAAAGARGPVTTCRCRASSRCGPTSANARRGPSLDQRVDWEFVHRGLPLEITAEYGQWRRVRDADGAGGWVHHALLSGVRTALVRGDAPVPLRAGPERGDGGAGDGRARRRRPDRGLRRRLVRDRGGRRRGLAAAAGALGRRAGRDDRVAAHGESAGSPDQVRCAPPAAWSIRGREAGRSGEEHDDCGTEARRRPGARSDPRRAPRRGGFHAGGLAVTASKAFAKDGRDDKGVRQDGHRRRRQGSGSGKGGGDKGGGTTRAARRAATAAATTGAGGGDRAVARRRRRAAAATTMAAEGAAAATGRRRPWWPRAAAATTPAATTMAAQGRGRPRRAREPRMRHRRRRALRSSSSSDRRAGSRSPTRTGSREEIENGRFEQKDAAGRTLIERPVTDARPRAARAEHPPLAGSCRCRSARRATRVEASGGAIEVTYGTGWREELEAAATSSRTPTTTPSSSAPRRRRRQPAPRPRRRLRPSRPPHHRTHAGRSNGTLGALALA